MKSLIPTGRVILRDDLGLRLRRLEAQFVTRVANVAAQLVIENRAFGDVDLATQVVTSVLGGDQRGK